MTGKISECHSDMGMFLKYVFGVVPAVPLSIASIMLAFIAPAIGIPVCLGALLGLYGMVWSLASYADSSASRVLFLLSVGIVTVGVPLVLAVVALIQDFIYPVQTSTERVGELLLFGWAFGGPFVVGLVQMSGALGRVRAAGELACGSA